jgi:hypothetical protein
MARLQADPGRAIREKREEFDGPAVDDARKGGVAETKKRKERVRFGEK